MCRLFPHTLDHFNTHGGVCQLFFQDKSQNFYNNFGANVENFYLLFRFLFLCLSSGDPESPILSQTMVFRVDVGIGPYNLHQRCILNLSVQPTP